MAKVWSEVNLVNMFETEINSYPCDLEMCKKIIDNLNEQDLQKCFRMAIMGERWYIIELFNDKNVDIQVNNIDRTGYTYLYRSVRLNILNRVKTAIALGANVNFTCRCENDWSPLHIAANENRYDIAKVLLENNADINIKNNCGNTPLDLAKNRYNKNIVKLLTEYNSSHNK